MALDVKPIIIDAGKQKRRRIKQLKVGEGPLADEVKATVAHVRGAAATATTQMIPVVVIYERRPKSKSKRGASGISDVLCKLGLLGY